MLWKLSRHKDGLLSVPLPVRVLEAESRYLSRSPLPSEELVKGQNAIFAEFPIKKGGAICCSSSSSQGTSQVSKLPQRCTCLLLGHLPRNSCQNSLQAWAIASADRHYTSCHLGISLLGRQCIWVIWKLGSQMKEYPRVQTNWLRTARPQTRVTQCRPGDENINSSGSAVSEALYSLSSIRSFCTS